MIGIISGLNASDENLNIVLSCDIPNITTEVLEKLIKVNLKNIEVALLESSEGKMPWIAIHKKENIKHYKACISQGKTGVFKAISTLRVKNIKVSELEKDSLKNINTKQEFLELCK